jgi:hypothetical protein
MTISLLEYPKFKRQPLWWLVVYMGDFQMEIEFEVTDVRVPRG